MPKWMDSARDFLGLGEDPYYDDDYDLVDDADDEPAEAPVGSRSGAVRPADSGRSEDDVRERDPLRSRERTGARARSLLQEVHGANAIQKPVRGTRVTAACG